MKNSVVKNVLLTAQKMNSMIMMKLNTTSLIFVACLLCSCKQEHVNSSQISITASRFQLGQVWTFRTTINESTNATLTIAHVDLDPKEGPVIFVSIKGIQHTFWESTNTFCSFSEDALNRSVITLVRTNNLLSGKELEDFQWSFDQIRKGVESGKLIKCFKITVSEALEERRKGRTH